MRWKNIAPLREMLERLPELPCTIDIAEKIVIEGETTPEQSAQLYEAARAMMPWRKGPFSLFGIDIQSEWNSAIKYALLEPHFDLEGKRVADIGCNNGYYMFRMLPQNPSALVGFDPSPLFKTQFDLLERYIRSGIRYELLGVEHLPHYEERFDTIFCLGVLYHRSDPITTLKALKRGLNPGGELFLDTFMIEGEAEVALTPRRTYAKIPNIYFIPTIAALHNWCVRAGFRHFEVLEIKKTDLHEQRSTDWIHGESLEHFLDPDDPERTIEGYPAPKRLYIKATL